MPDLDLVLAVLHHLAALTLLACLVAQLTLLKAPLCQQSVPTLARIDLGYGLSALAILVIGGLRVSFAAKGWEFYALNAAFWAKMALFAVIGGLSVVPTILFRRWLRAGAIPATQLVLVRRLVTLEVALFALLPVFAAIMARGSIRL